MRLILISIALFAHLVLASTTCAAENPSPSWTGNAELDAAFVLNNAGSYAEAFAAFKALWEKDVPMAGTMLGRYYEQGRSVSKSRTMAEKFYDTARQKGEVFGAYHYARLRYGDYGSLTRTDTPALMREITREAEAGNVPLQTVLASAYLTYAEWNDFSKELAWNPPNPKVRAEYWMKRAADAGYAPAQYNMADLDKWNSMEWLEKAAAAGYPPAVSKLKLERSVPSRRHI